MRVVGLDIRRVFAEAVMLDEGKIIRLGRIGMTHEHLSAFAQSLIHDDRVVIEATGKIKTEKIDASVLAKLHASNFCLKFGRRSVHTAGTLTAEALTRAFLDRIAVLNPHYTATLLGCRA